MISENFLYIILAIHFLGATTYMYDVVKGKAKPNRVSWLLWGVFAITAFFSSIDEGAGPQAYFTLIAGTNPLMIFALSFVNKEAYWKISNRDYALGAIAILGMVLWLATGEGELALALAILADFLAGLPTIIKSYTNPESESGLFPLIAILTSGATLLTISEWTFPNYGFPLYALMFTTTMTWLIMIRPKLKTT